MRQCQHQCPQCGLWMERFGPDDAGVFTHVCPVGHFIRLTHHTDALIVSYKPDALYERELRRGEGA